MASTTDSPVTGTVGKKETLGRSLGVTSIVLMVVAAAAPLAVIAATTPIIISVSGSIATPLLFIIAGVILLLFSVGFTLMSRHVKNAGAFYAYIQAGLGRHVGLGAAVLALASYLINILALYAYIGVATSEAIQRFLDTETPWWAWAIVVFAVVSALGYRDIALSSRVLAVLLIAEVLVVLVLDTAVFVRGGESGFSAEPFNPGTLMTGTPGTGIMFAFFTFIGFEATAVFRNEAKDPERTIPRATYIAVGSIGVFYAVSAFALIIGEGVANALAAANADAAAMVLDLITRYAGWFMHDVTQLLLVTSFFACILTFHNVLTRYQFTLGDLGVLPRRLGTVSSKFNAPSYSSLVLSAVVGVLLVAVIVSGLDPVTELYTWLSGAATVGIVTLMALTSIAVIAFFAGRRGAHNAWNSFVAPGLATLGLVGVLVVVLKNITLLIPNNVAVWLLLGFLVVSFVAGTGIAGWMRRRNPTAFAALHRQED
jgi:amino acid transporter